MFDSRCTYILEIRFTAVFSAVSFIISSSVRPYFESGWGYSTIGGLGGALAAVETGTGPLAGALADTGFTFWLPAGVAGLTGGPRAGGGGGALEARGPPAGGGGGLAGALPPDETGACVEGCCYGLGCAGCEVGGALAMGGALG